MRPPERTTDVVFLEDGGERPFAAFSNVREKAALWVSGATVAAIQGELRDVERIAIMARDYESEHMPAVSTLGTEISWHVTAY